MEVAIVVVCGCGGELGSRELGVGNVFPIFYLFSIFHLICLSQLFFVSLHDFCIKYKM